MARSHTPNTNTVHVHIMPEERGSGFKQRAGLGSRCKEAEKPVTKCQH